MAGFSDYGITIPEIAHGNIRTTCPECSSSRRKANEKCMSVNVEEGIWLCHHCGWSGGLLKKNQVEYKRPVYKPLLLPKEALAFFEGRKIKRDVLKANRVGFSNGNISFPYIKDGEVVNIKYRGRGKKFFQEKEAEQCLYRFDAISMLEGPLVITEGEMDSLACQSAGWSRVTSIPGGAISSDSISCDKKFDFLISAEKIIESCDKILLALDNDSPGKATTREMIRRIGADKCFTVEYPDGCKDANDVLMTPNGDDVLMRCLENAVPCPIPGLHTVRDSAKLIHERIFGEGLKKVNTGWAGLNRHYSPALGMFTIITGTPGAGKSTFLDNLMLNINQRNGWRFVVFSSENWPIDRHMTLLLEKLYRKKAASFSVEEVDRGIAELNEFLFFIYLKNEGMSLDIILEKARAAVYRYGIRGLVIDPWNEIEHQFQGMSEAQYLAQALSKIREFCATNQVHVWVVAHPRLLQKNNKGGYNPPVMYEISGGAHWRNKADFGLCVHRVVDGSASDITDVYIQKVRFSDDGKEGRVSFKMQPPGVFYELGLE